MNDRLNVVSIMQGWVGRKEKDGSHREIIDLYNTIKPLPSGYRVRYTDAWCATTVSAAFHKAGLDEIFPSECSCGRMIEKAKKMGIWQENDAYTPTYGDCLIYDWDDNGVGDCVGAPEHIGMVEEVVGNTMTIIEGNYQDSVKRRKMKLNGRYIRGYVTPKFKEGKGTPTAVHPTDAKFRTNLTYTLQYDMKVRESANGPQKLFCNLTADAKAHGYQNSQGFGVLKKGTRVTCEGTTKLNGATWMKIPSGWVCATSTNGTEYIK